VDAQVNGVQVLVDMRFILMLLDYIKVSTRPLSSPPKPTSSKLEADFEDSTFDEPRTSESDRVAAGRASGSSPPQERDSSLVITAVVREVLVALLEYREVADPRTLVLQVRK
jgi:hypothetical protein